MQFSPLRLSSDSAHGHVQLSEVAEGKAGRRHDLEEKRRRIKTEDFNRVLALVQDSVNLSAAMSRQSGSGSSSSNESDGSDKL